MSETDSDSPQGSFQPPGSIIYFCGVPFRSASPEAAVEWLCRAAKAGWWGHVHLLNAYSVVVANESSLYRDAVAIPAVNFPDGRPLASLTKTWPRPLIQIRGPQFFEDVLNRGRSHGIRHYLLGSTPETLELLERRLRKRFDGLAIVGTHSPPFRALTDTEIAAQDQQIIDAQPDVVWVGLGTPKQDYEAARLSAALKRPVVAVGAAFDFSAGTKKTAPVWTQRAGLEWAYRLMSEPRRLWRRYLIGNPKFLALYARNHIARSNQKHAH